MTIDTHKMLEGAANYAASDTSDPFAYNRAMTRIRNGIADPDNYYKAEPYQVMQHLPPEFGGAAYMVTRYKNMARP